MLNHPSYSNKLLNVRLFKNVSPKNKITYNIDISTLNKLGEAGALSNMPR